jgi:serine/threonine protein kinase
MKPLNADVDPRVVGPFELLARLGKGGMGVAYLARRIPLEGLSDELTAAYNLIEPDDVGSDTSRLVVVKMIKPELLDDDPRARERFGREIDAVRAVVGDRVPALIAFEEEPVAAARPWFAMEYIAGPSQHTLVKESGTLGIGPCAALGLALVDALRAIHGAKLLHRDLKPANVILGPDGPVVVDFGLAVLLERASSQALTKTGAAMGTRPFMPLEQFQDAKHVGPPADVYALGATLFFALTGRPPYPYGPMPSEPKWDGVAPPFLPLLGKLLVAAPGQRPDLDAVERSLLGLLAGADLTPRLAAEQLRAFVDAAGLTPQLPPGALTDHVAPAVQELAREAVDADLPDVDPGFFGMADTDDIEWAADAPARAGADGPDARPPALVDPLPARPREPDPQPEPGPAPTSRRLSPPRPPERPVPPPPAAAEAPPRAARKVAARLRERYAHRGDL